MPIFVREVSEHRGGSARVVGQGAARPLRRKITSNNVFGKYCLVYLKYVRREKLSLDYRWDV